MPGCTSAKSSCHGEMHCGLCADRAAEDDDESYDLADCLTCEDGYTFKQLNWDCTGTCVDTSDWCAQPVCNDSDDDGWPDVWDNAPGTPGFKDGENN